MVKTLSPIVIVPVPTVSSIAVFPVVEHLLRDAIARDVEGITSRQLALRLSEGKKQLHVVQRRLNGSGNFEPVAAFITAINGKTARLEYVGGSEMDTWFRDYLDYFVEFARGKGCNSAFCVARPGWYRILKPEFGEKLKQLHVLSLEIH